MSHGLDGEISLDLDGLSYRAPNGAVLLDAATLHLPRARSSPSSV